MTQSTPRSFRAPAAIFWTALALRLACIVLGHTYRIRLDDRHFDFGFEAGRIAESLVTGHGYGNPFNGPSGPTAWLPPLYPLLMALAFKLFGVYTNAAAIFLMACDSVFSALIAPAVYEIAARCFDAYGLARRHSRHAAPVALWSAWLWAVYPAALQYAIHWIWEMSLSVCLLTWTLVLALRLRHISEFPREDCHLDRTPSERSEPRGQWRDPCISPVAPQMPAGPTTTPRHSPLATRHWLLFGLLWGLIALSNASLTLVCPATILWILWPALRRPAPGLKQSLLGATLACLVILAVMSPWIVRNQRTLHAFIPTRSNLGVELWQSSLFYHDAFPWGTAMPLWAGSPEFQRYVRMGEVAYARKKGLEARANLRAHPGLFARFTLDRVEFFWFGSPHPSEKHESNEVIRILNYAFTSLAGLLGLALALRRRVPGARLLASVFLLVPIAYYVVTVQARFRHPIEPLLAIFAVYLFRSTTPLHAKNLDAK